MMLAAAPIVEDILFVGGICAVILIIGRVMKARQR